MPVGHENQKTERQTANNRQHRRDAQHLEGFIKRQRQIRQ
jgi:hypothetical protein